MRCARLLIFAAIATSPPVVASALPLPPPSALALAKATKITTPPRSGDVAAYGDLFASDVNTYDNGVLVAQGRAQWLDLSTGPRALGVKVVLLAVGNPILAVEEVNNMQPPVITGGRVMSFSDCCVWARTASYHLNEKGQVDEVRLVHAQSDWQPPPEADEKR